jgi:hypothetical protein
MQSCDGGFLSGSLKNQRTKTVNKNPSAPSNGKIKPRTTEKLRKIPKNLYPSG